MVGFRDLVGVAYVPVSKNVAVKGLFTYYVNTFFDFWDPPTHYTV